MSGDLKARLSKLENAIRPREQGGVTEPLMRNLRAAGGKAIKLHGGPMFSGHPDIFACLMGYCVVIETKREGSNGPTERQQENLARWTRAGAIALWTDDHVEGLSAVLREIAARDNAREQDVEERAIASRLP